MQNFFEEWFLAQFGQNKKGLLKQDENGGYVDETVLPMWIGFNARHELTGYITQIQNQTNCENLGG